MLSNICLINERNLPITHTMKWRLFYGIHYETPKDRFLIIKFYPKLSVLPGYCFWHVLHEKRYTALLESQFKLLGLMQFSL